MINLFGDVPPPLNPWNPEIPIAFRIGSLEVRWYAIFIMFGFILAIVLTCLKLWKRYNISIEPFYWFILIGVPVGIFGANFGSCVIGGMAGKEWSQFWTEFGKGLAIEWGIFFDAIAAAIYFPLVLKKNKYRVRDEFGPKPQVLKVSAWMYIDAIAPTILIAQFLGRWGNYFNQEVYGAPIQNEGLQQFLRNCLPWMWVESKGYCQPLFLWEGLANIVGFGLLYFGLEFINQRKAGDMSAAYFVWYGTLRLCMEPLRDESYKSVASIAFSAVWVGLGVLVIILNHTILNKWRKYKVLESISKFKLHNLVKIDNIEAQIQEKQQANLENEANQLRLKLVNLKNENRQFIRDENEMLFHSRW